MKRSEVKKAFTSILLMSDDELKLNVAFIRQAVRDAFILLRTDEEMICGNKKKSKKKKKGKK